MHIQPFWAYDLIDHVEFWQTEQGFDTIDIHAQVSSFWVTCFPEFCEESCACQQPLSVPCYQAQTLASNLAKSHRTFKKRTPHVFSYDVSSHVAIFPGRGSPVNTGSTVPH